MGVDEAFRSFLPDGGAFPVRLGVRVTAYWAMINKEPQTP